jgi:hypothetical protein
VATSETSERYLTAAVDVTGSSCSGDTFELISRGYPPPSHLRPVAPASVCEGENDARPALSLPRESRESIPGSLLVVAAASPGCPSPKELAAERAGETSRISASTAVRVLGESRVDSLQVIFGRLGRHLRSWASTANPRSHDSSAVGPSLSRAGVDQRGWSRRRDVAGSSGS